MTGPARVLRLGHERGALPGGVDGVLAREGTGGFLIGTATLDGSSRAVENRVALSVTGGSTLSLKGAIRNAGSIEAGVVSGSFGVSRAAAFMLRCKIVDVFTMDWQSASFSGELLRSISDFASTDLVFPNASNGEGLKNPTRGSF